jgi:hypothetical protein
MVIAFKFDSSISSAVIDGYRSITRTGQGTSSNGIFSIGKDTAWNSFNDATAVFTTTNLTVGSLGGLLKATAGVVGIASSGTDYEPPVTKGNLTESGSSIITFGGSTSGNVIGSGTTISIHKASAAQDGYLGKDDFATFNGKQDVITKYDLSETSSGILTITGGTDSVLTNDVTIAVQKASAIQDGYLGKNDFASFSASTHSPVTLNASAVTGGLSLSTQEISFRAADTTYDGYLKSSDWDTFNGKQDVITKYDLSETVSSILSITGGTDSVLTNGVTISVQKASAAQDGYLGKDNWATFNGKIDGAGTVIDNSVVRFNGTSGKVISSSNTYINDDGYIGINNINPLGEIHAKSNSYVDFYLETCENDFAGGGSYIDFMRSRGTIASKVSVQQGDEIACITASAYSDVDYWYSAHIKFYVDGAVTSNSAPGGIKFLTGATTEVARFKSDGNWFIGVNDFDGTPAVGRLVVQGVDYSGASNIFVGRDSTGTNVATLNTDGYWTMAGATIDTLSGLLKATAGVVGTASSGTDYEPPVVKTNLTETTSSILSITNGTGSVIGTAPVTIAVQKASAAQDGYLGKDNWATFNGKLTSPMTTNGDIIARIGGVADRLGIGSTGQVLTVSLGLPAWADPAAGTQITQGDTKVYVKDTGSDGYMAVVTEGVERMRITPAGYMGIGTSSPITLFDISSDVMSDCGLNTANSNAIYSSVVSLRRARNTMVSPSIVSSGDSLGVVEFDGYDGNQYKCAGYIEMHVDGTPGVNDMPGVFSLYLTPDGSGSSSEVLTVKSSGKMGIGVTEPSSMLDVAGSVEVTSSEYFVIGDPTIDGSWRIGLDSGNLVLQKRVTGAWSTKGSFA